MSNYNKIDLDKVKDLVTNYCVIEDAKKYIINEKVNFNPLIIKNNLKQTNEALSLLKDGFTISFDGIENINYILEKSTKNITLNGNELSRVLAFHYHCKRVKDKIDSIENELSIKDYSDSINVFIELATRLEKVIDTNGNIKSDASEKLKDIFYKIDKNNNDLHKAADQFLAMHSNSLQESNSFIRNDRITFLLKNSDKNKFKGYQYGTSSSGLATYVEPENFIVLNNAKSSLEIEKEEEVNRLLNELTYQVSKFANSYTSNFDSLLKLDVIFAKAEYGYYNCGIIPEISDDNSLYIKDGAHPLIDKKTVISNTYTLTKPYLGIVISGTNTGGKTVGLKLIGLSILMSYLGIPLIASEATIPLYNEIYIDIDDNQSINNALSTFSAHISNINEILKSANENSLILIDELISGTDPKEAQAISLSILERILELKSKFVVTTHYDDIKQFAYKNANIMLSSVGFNLEKLCPTYKYIENSVGVSNAVDIASRYFDDQSIIERAKEYIAENKSKEVELLDKLAEEIKEKEELNSKLNDQIKINENLNIELNNKINSFEKEKEMLKTKYLEELNAYIEQVKEEAYSKVETLNDSKDIKKTIEKIDSLKTEIKEEKKITFDVGDNVKIGDASQIGEILDIDGDRVSVNINGMVVKTKLNKLTKIQKIKKQEYKPKAKLNRVSREINLVGERVEDALVLLGDYLDKAYGSGLSECKVIHGFGTGQLRKGIREYLAKSRIVREFNNGDAYDGGSNVTIVKFK